MTKRPTRQIKRKRRRATPATRRKAPGPKAKSRRVDPAQERRLETEKFKAKGDLLAFAAKHPGALSGYFLAMVHHKLSHGRLTDTKQLRQASVTTWAAAHSGLTELRDQSEVQTLALVIDLINAQDLATAMGHITILHKGCPDLISNGKVSFTRRR